MKSFKTILVLAVVLGLSAIAINGVAYGQSSATDQSGDQATTFMSAIPDYQQYASSITPTTPEYADEAASGQSIIFENGIPTTVIGEDGTQSPYSAAPYEFLEAYYAGGPYGVGFSSNADVPTTGTWTSEKVVESGTFGTQEPNLNIS